MTPLTLSERICQTIASVGKKPDEQLSLEDLRVINFVFHELMHEARFDACRHAHVISGFCMDCAHAVEKGEDVRQPQTAKK